MPIPEAQLEIWSKQGSITQSKETYATIRLALEDGSAAYASKSFEIFLQGSYGNDTNIYADSDVDVVIKLNSTYYSDVTELSPQDLANYNAAFVAATYEFSDFRKDVLGQLAERFGSNVTPGNKAILIKGNGARREADVVAAAQFRRYIQFRSGMSPNYVEGISFWTTDGIQIINYPKLHADNCTSKHKATGQWFKPMVRILKNVRNTMISKGYLAEEIAPSYFLEGMLYNVPNSLFGKTYGDTFVNAINWVNNYTDKPKLLCANEQYYLLHAESPVTWRAEKLQTFLDATANFWASY